MRFALDTNVLAYAEGVNGAERREHALELVARLPQARTLIPVQVLGELFNVLVRKAGRPRSAAREAILDWRDTFPVLETTSEMMLSATDLATGHELGLWDAEVLSVASHAGCRLLLSEDLQPGFTWGGVTVVNPFVRPSHPALEAALTRDTSR